MGLFQVHRSTGLGPGRLSEPAGAVLLGRFFIVCPSTELVSQDTCVPGDVHKKGRSHCQLQAAGLTSPSLLFLTCKMGVMPPRGVGYFQGSVHLNHDKRAPHIVCK